MVKCILNDDPDREFHYTESDWETCACGKVKNEIPADAVKDE
jgi:hypothetical protein